MILLKKNILLAILLIASCLLTGCLDRSEPNVPPPTAAAAVTESVASTDAPSEIKYIGNTKSKIFHRTDCWWLPEEWNQIGFSNREEAIGENYSPCGNCNP